MKFDKKTKAVFAIGISLITIFLYLFFFSIYIKDETTPMAKVVPLYILVFTLLIATYISVENIENRKRKILLGLIIFCIQFGLGIFVTNIWLSPRSEYVIAHPQWLTHLSILASQHYTVGMLILFRSLFTNGAVKY